MSPALGAALLCICCEQGAKFFTCITSYKNSTIYPTFRGVSNVSLVTWQPGPGQDCHCHTGKPSLGNAPPAERGRKEKGPCSSSPWTRSHLC